LKTSLFHLPLHLPFRDSDNDDDEKEELGCLMKGIGVTTAKEESTKEREGVHRAEKANVE
jgi:hypothetical protein